MRTLIFSIFALFITGALLPSHAEAVYASDREVDVNKTSFLSAEEHFDFGTKAYENRDWNEAQRQFIIVTQYFPQSPYAKEAFFYLGVADFELQEYEFANQAFSNYLKASHPHYFEEAVYYKFAIAESFRCGARRRMFGSRHFPKCLNGDKLALEIYDEVVATMPCHEWAAQALYSKGSFLWQNADFRSAVDAFQTLIKRFPKHELALESYALINKIYLEQSQREFQNPDLIALAQLNLRKFRRDFPGEVERTAEAEQDIARIEEVYANGLYETGQFYERLQKPEASCLYYQNAVQQFPEAQISQQCRDRLKVLKPSDVS